MCLSWSKCKVSFTVVFIVENLFVDGTSEEKLQRICQSKTESGLFLLGTETYIDEKSACDYCREPLFVWNQRLLRRHERSYHEEKSSTCDVCLKNISRRGVLEKHERSYHEKGHQLVTCVWGIFRARDFLEKRKEHIMGKYFWSFVKISRDCIYCFYTLVAAGCSHSSDSSHILEWKKARKIWSSCL